MSSYLVRKSINIKASPSQVWDALTDPEKTKQYFFHCRVLSDWQPGSAITFKGKMFFFINITLSGKIVEIQPGRLLKYTLQNGKDKGNTANHSTVTIIINQHDDETILSVTDDVSDADGADKRLKRSEKGWDKIMSGLKKLVEAAPAS